jgi:hypothetical protein
MDLINALPGSNFVNKNTGNSRKKIVFYAVSAGLAHVAVGRLLPGNESVNMQPRQ